MVSMVCSNDVGYLNGVESDFRVLVYGSAMQSPDGFAIGNSCKDEITHLDILPSQRAFDFLTIALSVVSADSFILREKYGSDGFSRRIKLTISLGHPQPWDDVKPLLEEALCFLTGDFWVLSFVDGGERVPAKYEQKHIRKFYRVHKADSVSLFSGGLDSFIGAFHQKWDRNPVLVSRSSTGDQKYQNNVASFLPSLPRFVSNDSPQSPSGCDHEISTRSRSILFIALAGIVCASLSKVRKGPIPLVIPENGFIALNPPLTKRRIGANSTRTAHPYYLSSLQSIFTRVELPISIENPFAFSTKGEMLLEIMKREATVKDNAFKTVSCGHWKRANMQCGRCWPCLIRRAAFFKAGIDDSTEYQVQDLKSITSDTGKNGDLRAVLYAMHQYDKDGMRSSPIRSIRNISSDLDLSKKYLDVVSRGFEELREFLFEHQAWT